MYELVLARDLGYRAWVSVSMVNGSWQYLISGVEAGENFEWPAVGGFVSPIDAICAGRTAYDECGTVPTEVEDCPI